MGEAIKANIKNKVCNDTIMPPVAFCLERPESIGQDVDPDPEIYKCHPTVEQVYREIMNNYKVPNTGKIILNENRR